MTLITNIFKGIGITSLGIVGIGIASLGFLKLGEMIGEIKQDYQVTTNQEQIHVIFPFLHMYDIDKDGDLDFIFQDYAEHMKQTFDAPDDASGFYVLENKGRRRFNLTYVPDEETEE